MKACRFALCVVASGLHPDHDTIATFRKTFLAEIQELFVQILLLAQAVGVLKLGNISVDGSKIHADASKSKAVSYKRLGELETQLRQEVQRLLTLGEQIDQGERALPEGLVLQDEIARRKDRLGQLAEAKAVLQARAAERAGSKKPSMRPKFASAKKRRGAMGASPKGPRRNLRKRVRGIQISTISQRLQQGTGRGIICPGAVIALDATTQFYIIFFTSISLDQPPR